MSNATTNAALRFATGTAVTLAAAVLVFTTVGHEPQAQERSPAGRDLKGDVVLVRCDTAGGADLLITAYQGSTTAPAKKSSSCPESLSLLIKDGFAIRDIGHYDHEKAGFVVFTLLR
jgi:hypothetical protein